MTESRRQMRLGVFVLGTGNHTAGWRYEGAAASNSSWPVMLEIARTAERGKFDLFFISDSLAMSVSDHASFVSRFEPLTLLAKLSGATRHIGLGATVSTSFDQPYHTARAFASLDILSEGRAAWNVVTSSTGSAALNFSREKHMEHDLRYEVAEEFVDVVRGLWDTWEDGAMVADRQAGTFVDPSKVRLLNHEGRFFSVKGPLNIERPPQGHPVIIQAGGSVPGQELAARTADIVFSVVQELRAAKDAYAAVKERVARHVRGMVARRTMSTSCPG
jgi:N-acetyl-S-(2-succino)cysteine monooxygenase